MRNPQILVIDDDKKIRDYFCATNFKGYEFKYAANSQEAFAQLEKNAVLELIELILLDLNLGDSSILQGKEFLKKIRRVGNKIPVMLLTSNPDDVKTTEVFLYNIVEILEKPFFGQEQVPKKIKNFFDKFYAPFKDYKTGLFNYTFFEKIIKKEYKIAKEKNTLLSMAIIDFDNFGKVNKTYNHIVGDEVLKKATKLIGENIRNEDWFFRYGGEEFVVLFPDTDPSAAFKVLDKIREKLSNTELDCRGNKIKISFSGGIALVDDKNYLKSLEQANEFLKEAKSLGKNKILGEK